MRKLCSLAILLLAGLGFWAFFGDTSPSTRPSSTFEEAQQRERDFRERLRRIGSIVFSRGTDRPGESNLWAMEGDGTRQAQLTKSGHDSHPAWAPDGTYVAFLREEAGDPDSARIWSVEVSTGIAGRLSATTVLATAPAWSPDGHVIAFTHPVRDGEVLHFEVRTLNLQTGEEKVLGGGQQPSWSPDGKRLVASSLGIVELSAPEKRIRIPEGSDFRWSSDGQRIAFHWSLRSGALHTMDLEGNVLRLLSSQQDRVDFQPVWSPDGKRVAVDSAPRWNDSLDFQIHVVDAEGNSAQPLGAGYDPVWTPDGQGLIFTTGSPSQIWYMDADGKNRTNLSAGPTTDSEARVLTRPHR